MKWCDLFYAIFDPMRQFFEIVSVYRKPETGSTKAISKFMTYKEIKQVFRSAWILSTVRGRNMGQAAKSPFLTLTLTSESVMALSSFMANCFKYL